MKRLMIAAIAALALTAQASATNFQTVLVDLAGKPMTSDGKPDSPPMTLALVASNALLSAYPDEQNAAPEKSRTDKLQRFQLAVKITEAGATDLVLPAADVALIEQLIAKLYVPLVYGRAYEALEAKPPEHKK